MTTSNLHVAIVGAGIGGLACAIACRRQSPPIDVTLIERAPEILTIGAGIHIPPNACRVVTYLGVLDKLRAAGGYFLQGFTLRRYSTGAELATKPMGERMVREYGAGWMAIHRGDYQIVLWEEAKASGVKIMLDAEVTKVDTGTGDLAGSQVVSLKDGRTVTADIVVGADGLWSILREHVLGHEHPPEETGALAYRGIFSLKELKALNDPQVDDLLKADKVQNWLGPGKHCVFYPLRNHTEYNIVLIVHDDLPEGVRTAQGSIEEMAANFDEFDPVMKKMISCIKSALKWKLLHFKELDKWTRGTVALLGDASHPTLPHQGQGAAMAVEDGAVIGLLLGKLQATGKLAPGPSEARAAQLTSLLRLYEKLRKERTETNVKGAVLTKNFYHMPDGPEQEARDAELANLNRSNWQSPSHYNWADAPYQKSLLGFDVLSEASERFDEWFREETQS